jgi:general secretion pathway protein N
MKTKHFLIAAVSSYILFLLIYTPASAVIPILEKSLPQVKIEGVGGTIWNGRAQRITYTNKYILDDARWSICTWRLMIGEACVELDAKYNDNDLHSEIGINVAGTVKTRNLKVNLDAETLGKQLRLPLGKLSGDVFLDIEHMKWAGDSIPSTTGIIKWDNAAITFAEKVQLGAVSIHITESDEYPLTATISNKGGHMAINGSTNISDDGTYTLELKLLPGNNASTNLRKNLGLFAKKQSDGNYIIEDSGNLKQLGIL